MKGKCVILLTVIFFITPMFLFATGSNEKEGKVLRILTWEGYAPAELVEKFRNETGIDVKLAYVGDNNELIAKLAASKGSGFDLIQPTSNWVLTAESQYGVYQAIDLGKINTDNIDVDLLNAVTDATTINNEQFAVPFCWGTTALAVNTKYAPKAGMTYKDLLNSQYAGRISYRSKYDTFYMIAYALGLDPRKASASESEYRSVMEKVLNKLIETKKYVKTYWGSRQELEELLSRGEVWVASAWDAIGWSLAKTNPDIKYMIPEEGAMGWIDTFAISNEAENIDEAYAWINFIMMPENAAVITSKTGYLVASKGSLELSSPESKKLFEESFSPENIKNIKWYFALPEYAVDIEADVQERLKAATGN